MTDYESHDPGYSGTTTDDWDAPRENDFDTDDLAEIADHFLLPASGFPPEAFEDLKLPVADADGDLDLNALETAHGGAHSVEAVEGIDDGTKPDAKERIERLAREEFDREIGD
ncbi:hypothetical protein ACFQE1_14830 [Halobium palmae]|uniref:DUF5709 domain-containing protein n=1 Tax=Halobium palmae TaxID=1776492 RepID=A0ABD5S3M8_9EURY